MDGWIRTCSAAAGSGSGAQDQSKSNGEACEEETNIAAEQGDGAETVHRMRLDGQIFRIEAYENYVQNKERVAGAARTPRLPHFGLSPGY